MDIFMGSLFLGLMVACCLAGVSWASGDTNLLWLAGLSGLTTTSTAWLLGSLLFSASDVGRFDTSYGVRETAVLTPQRYIKGQLAVVVTSLIVGGLLIHNFGKFSMFLKTLYQVVYLHDTSIGLRFWATVTLLILLASITVQQFNKRLIGAQIIRASLRTGGYVMITVAIGCVLAMLMIMYEGYFLAKMIDNLLLLILCPLFAVIVGISHAICWDLLGLHPQKMADKFSVDAKYLACERDTLPFPQHIYTFWRGFFIALLLGFVIPIVLLAEWMTDLSPEKARWVWLIGFLAIVMTYSTFYYESFDNARLEKKEMYARIITGPKGHKFLRDMKRKQQYTIREEDIPSVVRGHLHEVWFVKPFFIRYTVAVRAKSQRIDDHSRRQQPSTHSTFSRVSNWFNTTAYDGLHHYTPQQLRDEISRYQVRIQGVDRWFKSKRRSVRLVRVEQRTRYRQQLRNALGRHYEQLGQVVACPKESLAHITSAIRLYEANMVELCRYIHPYQRLRILYTQQKQYEKAYAACQAYIGLPTHSKRALKSMTHHADKLQKRLKR